MFVDLSDILRQAGFTPAPLDLLRPDNGRVWISVLQHKGELLASASGIRNSDFKLAYLKHLAFLKEVSDSHEAPALVVTPEYSTPWAVVETILQEGLMPRVGAAWLLGCESITLLELSELAERHPGVQWHFGTQHLDMTQDGYVDPLIWIVRGEGHGGVDQIAVGVQIKCHEMGGDPDLIERDNLLLGEHPFFFRNAVGNEPSIRLAAIICADALHFDHSVDLPEYAHAPYIIIHPQCTPDAFHPLLTRYRNNVYGHNEGDRYAIISVNWAAGSSVNGAVRDFAGSVVRYRPTKEKKSKEPRQNDTVLNDLHKAGIYIRFSTAFSRTAPQLTTYFFNPTEYAYFFRCAKFDQVLVTGTVDREGVTHGKALQWDMAASRWSVVALVDDRVTDQIAMIGCPSVSALLSDSCKRERLIAFSIGELEWVTEWHVPWRFKSYRVNSDDMFIGTVAKLRSAQDPYLTNMLERYKTLATHIIPSKISTCAQFLGVNPASLTLILSSDVGDPVTFNSNLAIDGRDGQGVAVYIGETARWVAKSCLEELQATLNPNRAAVWYMNAGDVHVEEMMPKTITSPAADPRSISAEKKL